MLRVPSTSGATIARILGCPGRTFSRCAHALASLQRIASRLLCAALGVQPALISWQYPDPIARWFGCQLTALKRSELDPSVSKIHQNDHCTKADNNLDRKRAIHGQRG